MKMHPNVMPLAQDIAITRDSLGQHLNEAAYDNRCLSNGVGSSIGRSIRGLWESPWTLEHINVLELRAVYLSLRAFLLLLQNKHVLIRMDMSAVNHFNHQGGTRSALCLQAKTELLLQAFLKLSSLRAVYIPGVANKAADLLSRTGPLPGEWHLHPEVVRLIWGSVQYGED